MVLINKDKDKDKVYGKSRCICLIDYYHLGSVDAFVY